MPEQGQGQAAPTGLATINSAMERAEKVRLLLTLLERATSLSVLRDFLKSKQLPYSAGSWDDMRNKRLIPAFEEGSVTLEELHSLLRRTEGFGNQHVFLFMCRDADRLAQLLDGGRVEPILHEIGAGGFNGDPLVIDLPASPTIVDARFLSIDGKRCLSVKEIEKRTSRKLLNEQTVGDVYTKTYRVEHQRAINAARLWESGLLELRIASRHSIKKYREDLATFFFRVSALFPKDEFVPLSLISLKANLWENRESLKDTLRFSSYTLRDDEGASLRANVSLPTDDLGGHEGIAASLEEFQGSEVYCAESNIYFKPESDSESAREIHVLLSGEDNEFAVTSAITEEEYEHVLRKVVEHH